ncbi:hypothetical protein PMI07_000848 [Rhizobium sp. CF080]|uniref:hypothetical protein n=1 Tax=Rhizobium sp. (strain CF080) TaxID=1144310 RepID=UPI000271BCBE|nr:hypothetical protein [Rhizobium sp. CF080]EUB97272.1 hypothetical protein PMI07_000848 [Rhizobium sp. CF080]
MTPDNADRASYAALAIDAFTLSHPMHGEDDQTKAKDLVTNVFHFLRLRCQLDADTARNVMQSAINMAEIEANEDSDGEDDEPVLRTYGVRLFATFRGECDTEVQATSFDEAVAKATTLRHDDFNYSIDDAIEGDQTMIVYGPDEDDPNDDDKWGGDGVEMDMRKDGEPFSWEACHLVKELAALAEIKNETHHSAELAKLIDRAKAFCTKEA